MDDTYVADKNVNRSVEELESLRCMLLEDIAFKEVERRRLDEKIPFWKRLLNGSVGTCFWWGVGYLIGSAISAATGLLIGLIHLAILLAVGCTLLFIGIMQTSLKVFSWGKMREKASFGLRIEINKMRMRLGTINNILGALGKIYLKNNDDAEIEQRIADINSGS